MRANVYKDYKEEYKEHVEGEIRLDTVTFVCGGYDLLYAEYDKKTGVSSYEYDFDIVNYLVDSLSESGKLYSINKTKLKGIVEEIVKPLIEDKNVRKKIMLKYLNTPEDSNVNLKNYFVQSLQNLLFQRFAPNLVDDDCTMKGCYNLLKMVIDFKPLNSNENYSVVLNSVKSVRTFIADERKRLKLDSVNNTDNLLLLGRIEENLKVFVGLLKSNCIFDEMEYLRNEPYDYLYDMISSLVKDEYLVEMNFSLDDLYDSFNKGDVKKSFIDNYIPELKESRNIPFCVKFRAIAEKVCKKSNGQKYNDVEINNFLTRKYREFYENVPSNVMTAINELNFERNYFAVH